MVDKHTNPLDDNNQDSPLESFVAGRAGTGAQEEEKESSPDAGWQTEPVSIDATDQPGFSFSSEDVLDDPSETEDSAQAFNPYLEADSTRQNAKQQKQAYYTPVEAIGSKRRNTRFGKTFGLIFGALAIALLGFGGGMLAANQVGDRIQAQLADNFSQMLEDAGGAVLYRSVETNITNTNYQNATTNMTIPQVTELCADSVVEINTETTVSGLGMLGFSSYLVPGAGSGVVISENGYILTCAHVIDSAETINVRLRNGDTYAAQVIASDPESDVAIIKIEADGLSPAVLGSSEGLAVGDEVVAIGNPLGQLGGSVTNGIISALDREVSIQGKGTFNVLQTNAAINGGNSGGGLFNMQGELIGLVNAKASDVGVEGLAFALPIDDIGEIVNDLLNYGYVTSRGVKLGVTMVDISDERSANAYGVDEFGCYLLIVNAGSNAEYAGLQAGDRIVSADGVDITTADEVVELLTAKQANDTIKLVINRNGKRVTVDVTLYAVLPDKESSRSLQAR